MSGLHCLRLAVVCGPGLCMMPAWGEVNPAGNPAGNGAPAPTGALAPAEPSLSYDPAIERFDLSGLPERPATDNEKRIRAWIFMHRSGNLAGAILIQQQLYGYYRQKGDSERAQTALDRVRLGERVLDRMAAAAMAAQRPAEPSGAVTSVQPTAPTAGGIDSRLVFHWRIYSSRIDYDRGGHAAADSSIDAIRDLSLGGDGTWSCRGSQGTWSVQPITPADWKRWGSTPYGPTQKLVLTGWAGGAGAADGPIEQEANGRVNFYWLIYHVDKPSPGLMQIKFGRVK